MAERLDEKANLAAGRQKARLASLAEAHRIVARQRATKQGANLKATEFEQDVYCQILPHFNAAVASLARDCVAPLTIARALVRHLAGIGLDADEIRNVKPYAKQFTNDLIARRRSSMHQAAARYWNAIAESQPLKTEWAQQIFPLLQEDMDLALENEEERLIRETSSPALASAYLKIMPLLWESAAISGYLKNNPSLQAAMPPIKSIVEATMIAKLDFCLTTRELIELAAMLKEPPTPNSALRMANSIIKGYRAPFGNPLRCLDTAEMPRIAEALFRPSFGAQTLLRVTADSNHTIMELTSAESIFGRQVTHKNVVAPSCALRFWTNLDTMLAEPVNLETRMGLDGATINVNCRTPAGSANFEVWCPGHATYAGRLVGLIYDLARKASSAATAIECLEHLRGYLRD